MDGIGKGECPKFYHAECMDNIEKIECRWHTCYFCKKSSNFQCICCPDFSVCAECMSTSLFVKVRSTIWPTTGLCINCLSTVIMIEKSVEVDSDGVKDLKVDFDDSSTSEFYFKRYWKAVNKRERLPLDGLEKDLDYLESFNKEEQRKSKRKKIKEEGSEDDKKKRRSRNENKQCPTCKDTKGLCESGSRMENEFTVTLPVDFESSTPIPCYIREQFLKYCSGINDIPGCFKARLCTKHSFKDKCTFSAKVKDCSDVTIICDWRKFTRLNQLKVGMELVFEFNETSFPEKFFMVAMQSPPILPSSYYTQLHKLGRKMIDEMDNTCNAKLNWKQMEYVVNHIVSICKLLGGTEGSCITVPTLQKLKIIDQTTFWLNIPPSGMHDSGAISILYNGQPAVASAYKIITGDQMSLDGWKHVMASNAQLKIGDLLLFTLYVPSTGPYLVVDHVPEVELE